MAETPKKKRHYTGWLLAFVAVAGVGALVFAALKPQPVTVEIGHATRGAMELVVHEDGRTRVKERYTVSAPLAGNLARPTLREGDRVKAGQPVATLMPLSPALLDQRSRLEAEARVAAAAANEKRAAAQVARAEAALSFAADETKRRAELRKGDFASGPELERAQMSERTAREDLNAARFAQRVAAYELRMARAALGSMNESGGDDAQMEIPSPIDGTVLEVRQESEGVVQPGTALLELGDLAQLEAVVDVLTADAVDIAVGAPARIVRWGGEGPLAARVRSKEPSAFSTRSALGVEEQRVNVVLELTDPLAKRAALGDGYRVEAQIRVWYAESVLRVPASAVFRDEQGWAVFTVVDEHAQHRSIETGHHGPSEVEVLGGLEAGDAVVLYPSDRVVDGTPVQAR